MTLARLYRGFLVTTLGLALAETVLRAWAATGIPCAAGAAGLFLRVRFLR